VADGDSGQHQIAGYMTNVRRGPVTATDEASQTLSFYAIPDNPSLFVEDELCSDAGGSGAIHCSASTVPDSWYVNVDPTTGALRFKVKPGQSGTTIVSVYLKDDGGTFDGGDDTSPTSTFTITVNAFNKNDAPVFTGSDVTVLEDAGAKSIANWATGISQGGDDTGQTLTFFITNNSNAALFSSGPVISSTGTLNFTPAANKSGTATLTVELRDSGGTANGGDDTSDPQTWSITVTAVNDIPTFTAGPGITLPNGTTGAQTHTNWATGMNAGPDEAGQTLTFNATVTSGASLFTVPPAVDVTTGTLTYTLSGTSGVAFINLTLTDDGGTANGGKNTSVVKTFFIEVGSNNLPPTFAIVNAIKTSVEDQGPITHAGWISSISPGRPSESAQVVNFLVTTANDAMFSVLPAISSNGTLTYTSAPNAYGTVTITVVAKDNGGTANGGVDTSDPKTFDIQISPLNDRPTLALASPNVARGENPGTVSVAAFATATAGPLESGQTPFSYTVTAGVAGNPNLFAAGGGGIAPAIAADGTLTFTPADDQFGSATFSVTVKDSGGTFAGGQNTSLPETFTITISDGGPIAPAGSVNLSAYANIPLSITSDVSDTGYRLMDGASDPQGNELPLTLVVASKPANGLFTIDDPVAGTFTIRSGDLSYAAGAVQPQTFKYKVCDAAGNCSAPRSIVVSFYAPLVFMVDDNGPANPGLGTTDSPSRAMMPGFDYTSPAPPATYLIMSGSYVTGPQGTNGYSTSIRGGDQVLGQGLPGLTWASLGVVDPPVGTLPALPDLTAGTKPSIHISSPWTSDFISDPTVGALFHGRSGGTVRNLTVSKAEDFVGSWLLLAPVGCCAGKPGIAGDYVFDRITHVNGQAFIVGPPGSTLTVTNSTFTASSMFGANEATITVINTPITVHSGESHTDRRLFMTRISAPANYNVTLTTDASSPIVLTDKSDLFETPADSHSATTPVGTYTFNGAITITRTTAATTGLEVHGKPGFAVHFNGKVDVTTVRGTPLRVTASAVGAGLMTMSHAANTFKMTNPTLTNIGTAVPFSGVQVGAAGVNLGAITIRGGNLSFTDTGSGAAGPITVTSGSIRGNDAQPCVARTNAPNVTVSGTVTTTNCTP
jgi:hypothetical protein